MSSIESSENTNGRIPGDDIEAKEEIIRLWPRPDPHSEEFPRPEYFPGTKAEYIQESERQRVAAEFFKFNKDLLKSPQDDLIQDPEKFHFYEGEMVTVRRGNRNLEEDWFFMGVDAKSGYAILRKIEKIVEGKTERYDLLTVERDLRKLQILNGKGIGMSRHEEQDILDAT